jgi:hypothetical protein
MIHYRTRAQKPLCQSCAARSPPPAPADQMVLGERQYVPMPQTDTIPPAPAPQSNGARSRNTLKGSLTLTFSSDLTLRECSLHAKDERRRIALPSPMQIDAKERRYHTDPAGKRPYNAIVEIPDKTARERFNAAALAPLDELLLGAGGDL